jgi:putative DNA primase/helicase
MAPLFFRRFEMNKEEITKHDLQEDLNQGPGGDDANQGVDEAPKPKPCTDLGNAERLVERFGHLIRYCSENKRWLVYRTGRWIHDSGGRMYRMAYKVARSIYAEAKDERFSSEQVAELKKHARKSSSKGRIRSMVDLARWFPGIAVPVGLLDRDPWSLNCQNGTLDLRTGELRPHNPNDLITKMLPVDYDPEATCPIWEETIEKIMGGDQEKIGFLKRVSSDTE